MSKTTILRVFWGSLIALAGALVLFMVSGILVYTSGSFVMDGPAVVGLKPDAFGWSMIGVAAFALLVMAAAALAQLIAWVGAVLNTANLPEKTWFVVLLVTGLVGFGFVAMVAYAIAGPDSTRTSAPQPETVRPEPVEPVSV